MVRLQCDKRKDMEPRKDIDENFNREKEIVRPGGKEKPTKVGEKNNKGTPLPAAQEPESFKGQS